MEFEATSVAVFVLALARTSAWVAASPLFSANGIAGVGRVAFAISLAFVAIPISAGESAPPGTLAAFITVLLGQVAMGLLLGWITGLAVAVFLAAGAIIDLSSGLSVGALLDPSTGSRNAVMGRLYSMSFIALFFATNAHLVVVRGFVRTWTVSPVTEMPVFRIDSVTMAAEALSDLMLAALEIAAPVLGALLLAEVALALTARFVPQANVFMIGLPLKLGVALAMVGSSLIFMPAYTERVVDHIATLMTGAGT